MIDLKEALDWELISPVERQYLLPEEQDILICIRDVKSSYAGGYSK